MFTSLHQIAAILTLMTVAACAPAADQRRTVASYDQFSRRLLQLSADQDGDGRLDQWTYLDGNRPLRGEADTDKDGRIDRWEYFDATAALVRVGTSSANDGIEDTWSWVVAVDGEMRIDHSRHRDHVIDRREYFRGPTLIRDEEDTNADGQWDRWDAYEGTVLRLASFDTTLTTGRPNRRVVYDAKGQFQRVEADPDLNGTFETVKGATEPDGSAIGVRR